MAARVEQYELWQRDFLDKVAMQACHFVQISGRELERGRERERRRLLLRISSCFFSFCCCFQATM